MKSINRVISLLAISLVTLASCEKEYVYNNGPEMKSIKINVASNAWRYTGVDNNNYFTATVSMPEINAAVFKEGLVKMYRVYDWDKSDAAQTELPYIRHNEYLGDDGLWYFYTETVDYEFSPGQINIYYSASDFKYELVEFNPGPMEFRCVVVY